MSKKEIKDTVAEAEKAVSGVSDPELKKVAFQTVLQHLLHGEGGQRVETTRSAASGKVVAPKAERSSGKKKGGLLDRLEELVAEGFFKQPKAVREVIDALAERACHVKTSDLTWQMINLTEKRVLRRKKESAVEGQRKVWRYSNW